VPVKEEDDGGDEKKDGKGNDLGAPLSQPDAPVANFFEPLPFGVGVDNPVEAGECQE
jgi:hypothetical protein